MSSVNPESHSGSDQKIKLKFRVTSQNGPNGRWSEKWGVSVYSHEEFQVTDQLLKLPFQGKTPEVICSFSVPQGQLEFKMIDEDRTAAVNGIRTRKINLKVGDRLSIGEQILVEVLIAPELKTDSSSPKSKVGEETDGPTLSSIPPEDEFPPLGDIEPNPTLTFAPQDDSFDFKMEQQRIEAEEKNKKEREKAANDAIHFKDQKFSLAETPHETFDPGFAGQASLELEEPTVESPREVSAPQPIFLEETQASSRVIHKDHLSPATETIPTQMHPGDLEATRVVNYPKEKTQITTQSSAPEAPIQLENQAAAAVLEKIHSVKESSLRPENIADLKSKSQPKTPVHQDLKTVTNAGTKSVQKPALKPWIPEFQPLTERVKKRAIVFLGSAFVALALGAFAFVKWGSAPSAVTSEAIGTAQVPESLVNDKIEVQPLQPGIPIEDLEKKIKSL
jgi:hypothetical protein